MKVWHVLLGSAFFTAAGLVLFGDRSTTIEIVESATHPTPAPFAGAHPSARDQQGIAAVTILRLRPRTFMSSEGAISDADSDPFASRDWTPAPQPSQPAAPPPPPPSAPPLPFTFMGMGLDDGAREVYLRRDTQALIVREQEVIDGAWRVESIKPPVMTLVYLPLGQSKQINIGVFE